MVDGLIYICTVLRKTFDHYDWVGFYFADLDKKMLHLKAYSGNPVEHQQIPFGKGICGQVAVSNQNFIVPDVNAQDNYLACSIDVKSEIVIPLFLEGQNIGQIDIDSHDVAPFTKDVNIKFAGIDEVKTVKITGEVLSTEAFAELQKQAPKAAPVKKS